MFYLIERPAEGPCVPHAFESEDKYRFFADGRACSESTFEPCTGDEFERARSLTRLWYFHPWGGPRRTMHGETLEEAWYLYSNRRAEGAI